MSVATNRFIGLQKFWKLTVILTIIGVIITGIFTVKDYYLQRSFVNLHFALETLPKDVAMGMNITYRGIDVGKIKNVTFDEKMTSIIVDVQILQRVVDEMKSDSEIRIVPSLVGKPDVLLDLGSEKPSYDISKPLNVKAEQAMEDMARKQVQVFSEKLGAIIPNIDAIINNTAKLTSEAQKINFGAVNELIESVNSSMKQVNILVTEVAGLQGTIKNMAVNLDSTFGETKKLLQTANKISSELVGKDDNFMKSIKNVVTNLESLSVKLRTVSDKTETILTTYNQTGKNINKLTGSLADEEKGIPALMTKVNELAVDADIIAKALQEHWLLKSNVDKVKGKPGAKSYEDIFEEKKKERERKKQERDSTK